MSYKLTLTISDRRAIDWVEDRYSGAPMLYSVWRACETDPNRDWDDDGDDFTLIIPEHLAWEIQRAVNEDMAGGHSAWPCFAPELRDKLNAFLDSIV